MPTHTERENYLSLPKCIHVSDCSLNLLSTWTLPKSMSARTANGWTTAHLPKAGTGQSRNLNWVEWTRRLWNWSISYEFCCFLGCYLTTMVDLLLLTQPSTLTKSGILQNKHNFVGLILHWKWRGNQSPIPCFVTDTHIMKNHFLGKTRVGEGQRPQERNRPLVKRRRIRVTT